MMRLLVMSAVMVFLQFEGIGSVNASEQGAATQAQGMTEQERSLLTSVDELFFLQDRAAAGSTASVAGQKALLLSIGKAIAGMPADQHRIPASLIAAYMLSGGDPQVAEGSRVWKTFSQEEQKLLEASARFMMGERQEAAQLFGAIDALRLPARLTGRVALAQALLSPDESRRGLLSIAVSAMPGTLIEESALRRSAIGFAESHEEQKFWRRLERYVRRFPSSIYAKAFWEEVVVRLATWSAKDSEFDIMKLDVILASLPVAERRRIYLALARRSAATVRADLVSFAGPRLRRLAVQGSAEEKLGLFFTSLYEIASENGPTALTRLKSTPRPLLNPVELALLDAAVTIGDQIEGPLPAPPSDGGVQMGESDAERRGADLLAESSKMIAELN